MVKSKKEAANKGQAIRDALAAHPEKSPSEIAEQLKAKGLDVNAQYVSTIKFNAKAKGRKSVMRRKPGRGGGVGFGPVAAAMDFIRAAGSLEAAKHALQMVEEIRLTVRECLSLPNERLGSFFGCLSFFRAGFNARRAATSTESTAISTTRPARIR